MKKKQNNFETLPAKQPKNRQSKKEQLFKAFIYAFTIIVALVLLVLVVFVIVKSTTIFAKDGFFSFIFGSTWNPASNGKGQYGIGMIIATTLVMLIIAMIFAVPLTLFSTLFISEYLSRRNQKIVMGIIKVLAGVPSVVFGLFAREQIGALFRMFGAPSNDNLMVASFTMAFMAIPTMISLSYNAFQAVPEVYRFSSLGLGVSKEKTTFSIVRKSATPKIITAVIMGMSRVIGETMAIMMIAGNATGGFNTDSGLAGFLFSSIRTLAGTIGIEMQENAGTDHQSALFAIGLVLFILVFIINISILVVSNLETAKRKRLVSREEKNIAKSVLITSSNTKAYTNYELLTLVKKGTANKWSKNLYSTFTMFLMWSSTIVVIGFTFWLLGVVAFKGLIGFQHVDAFASINGESGIFAALLTTILLIFSTLIFGIPLALAAAIYLAEFSRKNSLLTKIFRFSINLLASTPSIVFGIFGLSVFIVMLGLPFSVLAASMTMAIVILPMLISNFEDALTSVPESYKEAGAALGMSKTKILLKIVLPNSAEAIITGIILAMAKIIGESAPVYLTLGTAIRMPTEGFLSSGATLTTGIYKLASEAGPGKGESIAYLMSLMTIVLVFALNTTSSRISTSISKINKQAWYLVIKERFVDFKNYSFKTAFKNKINYISKVFQLAISKIKYSTIKTNFINYINRKKEIREIKKGGEE
ncbi:phosphate ABC transporter permease PstA [Williamsoniiplasma somnilux]|nr:phosphate ABC transporter permease PstA [Williamsoniiplasma somnilux]